MNRAETQPQRLTANRRAVLETIAELPGHPTAAQVFAAVHERRPRMAYGTVYAALHYLVDQGLVASVRRPDGVISFDREIRPHDHAVCRLCGTLVDVYARMPSSYTSVEQQTGFALEYHRVEYVGVCEACQMQRAARI